MKIPKRIALARGTAVLLGAALCVSAAKSVAAEDGQAGLFANVKSFGAKGDGKSGDTAAIRKALASLPGRGGVVYFPPGHYLTHGIAGGNHVTFRGDSAWGYRAAASGAAILSPVKDDMKTLFDLDGSVGTRLSGLTLDGLGKGKQMHGVYARHHGREQNIVVDDCKITGFSGSGIRLDNAWVFNIRHSMIQRNQDSGIDGTGSYDGWILDNQITANGRGGIYGARFATVTITANRIEWNRGGGILLGPEGANTIQIANCTFDRNYGPGIDISLDSPKRITSANAITGNIFRRNGFLRDSEPEESVHLRLRNVKGVAVTGNTFFGGSLGGDEAKKRPPSPRYGMILQNLAGCVVANNSLYHAALEEVILDRGGHENTVIRDNPGSRREPGFDPR